TRWPRDWSSDVCSSDLLMRPPRFSDLARFREDERVVQTGDQQDVVDAEAGEVGETGRPHQVSSLKSQVSSLKSQERAQVSTNERSEERRVGKECKTER